MSGFVFNQVKNQVLLGFNWQTAGVEAALVARNTWAPNKSDDVLASIFLDGAVEVAAAGYARQALGTPTVTLDDVNSRVLLACDTIDFPAMTAGSDYDTLVIFTAVTDDGDSWLIAEYDLGSNTTDGSDVQCVPDAAGLIEVTG